MINVDVFNLGYSFSLFQLDNEFGWKKTFRKYVEDNLNFLGNWFEFPKVIRRGPD